MSVDQITAQDEATTINPTGPDATGTGVTAPEATGGAPGNGAEPAANDTGTPTVANPTGEKPRRGRPRKQSTARKVRTVELNLTITGTLDGDWQAELTHSGERVVSGMQVPAASVARAARELDPTISQHIDDVISAAKRQHLARVAELEAQLEEAKKALAELES